VYYIICVFIMYASCLEYVYYIICCVYDASCSSCVLHYLCVYNAWIMFTILVLHIWYLILCMIRVCKSHVRCSVLHCVVVYCRVLQCIAVCCDILRCIAVRCSLLQHAAVIIHASCVQHLSSLSSSLNFIFWSPFSTLIWSFVFSWNSPDFVCVHYSTPFHVMYSFLFHVVPFFFDPSGLRSFAYTLIFLKESFHDITFEVGARLVIFLPRRNFFVTT